MIGKLDVHNLCCYACGSSAAEVLSAAGVQPIPGRARISTRSTSRTAANLRWDFEY